MIYLESCKYEIVPFCIACITVGIKNETENSERKKIIWQWNKIKWYYKVIFKFIEAYI